MVLHSTRCHNLLRARQASKVLPHHHSKLPSKVDTLELDPTATPNRHRTHRRRAQAKEDLSIVAQVDPRRLN